MDVGTEIFVTSVSILDANVSYQEFNRSRPAGVFQICEVKSDSSGITCYLSKQLARQHSNRSPLKIPNSIEANRKENSYIPNKLPRR